MSEENSQNQLSYCGELVRQHDYDRFLCSMFLPAAVREDVWALLAFNHEISKTREVVSESTLGLIRLQWWRDAIDGIYERDEVLSHEVIKPMAAAIKKHDLPREHFDKLLYAREFDLEDVLPGNIEGLMNYCDFTTSPLLALIVQATGDDPDQHVIQPVAMNYAMAGVLRATASLALTRRVMLPEDLMNKHNLDTEHMLHKEQAGVIAKIVEECAAAKLAPSKPSHIFLKSIDALSEMYFHKLKKCDYNVMQNKEVLEPSFKVLRLFWKTKIM